MKPALLFLAFALAAAAQSTDPCLQAKNMAQSEHQQVSDAIANQKLRYANAKSKMDQACGNNPDCKSTNQSTFNYWMAQMSKLEVKEDARFNKKMIDVFEKDCIHYPVPQPPGSGDDQADLRNLACQRAKEAEIAKHDELFDALEKRQFDVDFTYYTAQIQCFLGPNASGCQQKALEERDTASAKISRLMGQEHERFLAALHAAESKWCGAWENRDDPYELELPPSYYHND